MWGDAAAHRTGRRQRDHVPVARRFLADETPDLELKVVDDLESVLQKQGKRPDSLLRQIQSTEMACRSAEPASRCDPFLQHELFVRALGLEGTFPRGFLQVSSPAQVEARHAGHSDAQVGKTCSGVHYSKSRHRALNRQHIDPDVPEEPRASTLSLEIRPSAAALLGFVAETGICQRVKPVSKRRAERILQRGLRLLPRKACGLSSRTAEKLQALPAPVLPCRDQGLQASLLLHLLAALLQRGRGKSAPGSRRCWRLISSLPAAGLLSGELPGQALGVQSLLQRSHGGGGGAWAAPVLPRLKGLHEAGA
mmetsp:Transcript_47224/g.85136  ORF Transcript_47224/g.85136 Transcript_47224/m.85136 type:complete len:309 (+) Transcript_47224:464-1390(+)